MNTWVSDQEAQIENIIIQSQTIFFSCVSGIVSCLFAYLGGKVLIILKKFPQGTTGRNSKIREIAVCMVSGTLSYAFLASFSIAYSVAPTLEKNAYVYLVFHVSTEVLPTFFILVALYKPEEAKQVGQGTTSRKSKQESSISSFSSFAAFGTEEKIYSPFPDLIEEGEFAPLNHSIQNYNNLYDDDVNNNQ
eukprot:TRINITY_DN4245_c0_g1_i1.p1 TRINITY_DN4245_c0_g1~~TRINITY_DN4245_c0_g1_i1.p1  ORF type:complete len:191 (+),score=20.95 TRINITY_DN4245_c0_g1_i1:521-1093(+)